MTKYTNDLSGQKDIYEAVARNLGDILTKGTPTNCTASSFQSDAFIFPQANQLQGKFFYFYEGAGVGQSRVVASYNVGSLSIYISPKFGSIPSINSSFILLKNFKMEDYENAFERAVGKVKQAYLVDMIGTNAVVGTQYEYPVPSGMEWVYSLRLVPSTNSDYSEDSDVEYGFKFPGRFWRIEQNVGGSYLICFDSRKIDLGDFNNQIIRIQGQGKPDFVATLVPEDVQEYIIAVSSMQLAAQLADVDANYKRLFYMYRDEVKGSLRGSWETPGLESYLIRYGQGKKVRT